MAGMGVTDAGALDGAARAIRDGLLVVLPTDTVYGVAADAFAPEAVRRLLEAKGRGEDRPSPVLVADPSGLSELAGPLPGGAVALAQAFWPGALTLVVPVKAGLGIDLGQTDGTVAVRVPDNGVARDLLRRTGPLAVSSANLTGLPPATTVADAQQMLGDKVAVYLDGGPTPGPVPSTIVSLAGAEPVVLREGAIPATKVWEVLGRPRPASSAGTLDGDAAGTLEGGAAVA
jgi:tRNA threonylcarbamoyl adenosine modification protein (Sua5/YciO/YrdC/YwlC family)